jgi:hypothetical protein
LGGKKANAAYPGRVSVRDPEISIKNDNFIREAVE